MDGPSMPITSINKEANVTKIKKNKTSDVTYQKVRNSGCCKSFN